MAGRALLGISPGTRVIGLAVMHKGQLVEWKVKTFKETWSSEKRKTILAAIDQMCEYYGIEEVSIKKIDPLRSSLQLDMLIAAIVKLCEHKCIQVHIYSLSDLDYDARTGRKQTKDSLSAQVAHKHPQLKKKYLRERQNRTEYYTKMFEAVAMAERWHGTRLKARPAGLFSAMRPYPFMDTSPQEYGCYAFHKPFYDKQKRNILCPPRILYVPVRFAHRI